MSWQRAAAAVAVVLISACGGSTPGVPQPTGTVTDVEGNVYPTIGIGTQEWTVENLKTTTYNDSTPIPNVTAGDGWSHLTSDAYAWYDNDVANKDLYGALYNWYVIQTEKVCPTGWAVPSVSDWGTLANTLGGRTVAGGRMKEAGTAHWHAPNEGATNQSGFSALPAGTRDVAGVFLQKGGAAGWWTSNNKAPPPDIAYPWQVTYETAGADASEGPYGDGFSVRCMRLAN